MSGDGSVRSLLPIIFIDDAHTFGGTQIALGWAIRAILQQYPTQPIVCICTPGTRKAVTQITGENTNLRFIACPPALPINIFIFPLRLWSFYKLLKPFTQQEVRAWWLNLADIEFCLAPLFILRSFHLRPVAWLHNNETSSFFSANRSLPRKALSRVRDAIANRCLFGQYSVIVTPSHATEMALRTRFRGGRSPRTGFLHPYVNLSNGTARHPSEKSAWREGQIDLWMIGRVDYAHKNALAGLEVLRRLRTQGKAACLTVVGDGADMAHFRSSTEEMGLSDFVRFNGWQNNPWEFVPEDAIVLIPSLFESFCLVAKEAMLHSVRMVLSPLPVFFEWVPSELIARDFSTEAFAERVGEVSALSRDRMIATYAAVLEKFSEEAFVARFWSVLEIASGENQEVPRFVT